MSPGSIEVEQAWPGAQSRGGPVALGLEGRCYCYPGRSVGRVRWPASRYAGAEPGRAAGRRGTSLGKSGRYFVAPSLAIARRRRTLAAHCRISAVGVSDAPADRTDRHRLSPHNDLSPVRMPPAVKRLFIDYGVASSRPGVGGQGVAVLPGGASVPISSRPRQQRFSQVGHVFPLVWTAPAEGTPPWGARGKDL